MGKDLTNIGTIEAVQSANIRKEGPRIISLPVAGATAYSDWFEITDFTNIVGTAFTATSASTQITITAMTLADQFAITGSDDSVYVYSASLNATGSLHIPITSASLGDAFYITGSNGTIYTYSASLNATASLAVTLTTASIGDAFYITGSNGTIYTYSASGGPVPADATPIYYFATGSELSESIVNLKDQINISNINSSISASSQDYTLNLFAKLIGETSNNIGFQSGSIQNLLAGGHSVPADSGNIYYFDITQGTGYLNAAVNNLKDEINNSAANTFITASSVTSTLNLFTIVPTLTSSRIEFQSGSTQSFVGGGNVVSGDTGNIYYFDIGSGSVLNTSVANLKDEINNSNANTFITASADGNVLNLYITVAESVGTPVVFESGSTTEYNFINILQSDSGSSGVIHIEQSPLTASVDYSGSSINIADSNGISFSQTLFSKYVRLKYVQTGSLAPNFLRIYSYLVP